MKRARKRHITKALTWRLLATLITFLLAIILFKDDPKVLSKSMGIAATEIMIKLVFYYFHERVWFNVKSNISSRKRHLFKTLTWRVLASITTFSIALVFFQSTSSAFEKATLLSLFETLIKMVVYYLHERVWHLSKYNLK